MPDIGVPELLVILVIILVIFGPSRITEIMGALGKGIGEFRKGSTGEGEPAKLPPPIVQTTTVQAPTAQPPAVQPPTDQTPTVQTAVDQIPKGPPAS